jgi:hypothetical protein
LVTVSVSLSPTTVICTVGASTISVSLAQVISKFVQPLKSCNPWKQN